MRILLFILTGISLLAAQSCKKECHDPSNPDCENYDPCYGKNRTSADFTINEIVGGKPFETDEIWHINKVRCIAKQDFDSYEWVVGDHVDTFSTKGFELGGFPEGQTFKVRLIGKRQPNTHCFADDDGIDTVIKFFKVTAHDSLLPIFGTYEGTYGQYPDKKITVEVGRLTMPDVPTWRVYDTYFTNIPVEGTRVSKITSLGATAFYLDNLGFDDGPVGGYAMMGYIYLSPDKKTLKGEYTHWDTTGLYNQFVRISGSYTGTRK
jgi:hypothetical protein